MPPAKRFETSMNAACTQELKDRVEALAGRQGRLPADVIRQAVTTYVTKEEGRAPKKATA